MKLLTNALPATVAQRLLQAGWQSTAALQANWQQWHDGHADTSCLCLSQTGEIPDFCTPDLLVCTGASTAITSPSTTISLRWQDNPFAARYGFLLMVGGAAPALEPARPLLDALAPAPGAWLHAGGLGAPAFLAALAQEMGCSFSSLAGLMQTLPGSGWQAFWQVQRQLLERLGELARAYLAATANEEYLPLAGSAALFNFVPPGGQATDSVARHLAQLLLWLQQYSPQTASPS